MCPDERGYGRRRAGSPEVDATETECRQVSLEESMQGASSLFSLSHQRGWSARLELLSIMFASCKYARVAAVERLRRY